MKIGVMNPLRADRLDRTFEHVKNFGLETCQLASWNPDLWTAENADKVVLQQNDSGVSVCAFWAGVPGPAAWNFTEGPVTLGLVPPEYRAMRIEALKKGADFARAIGARAVITHCGFIPENLTDSLYRGVVVAIREVAKYCAARDLGFWFETGQETPVVLLRTIEEVGTGNLGINLDPANLILYGKGNPVDALDVFGAYVENIHVKDGLYPTDGRNLGKEVQVGEGKVDFPAFMKKLKEIGFGGEFIIEREIREGEEQNCDIRQTVDNLRAWWG
jgi:L-ribulose-5-phosphate 3-epimerase